VSVSVSYVLAAGDTYTPSQPFWGANGELNAAVQYDGPVYAAIQGPPAQLRELAAALIGAAAAAEEWAASHPRDAGGSPCAGQPRRRTLDP
jgi:hypothetical protein